MSQTKNPIFCSSLVPNSNKIFTYKNESFNVDFNLIKRNCKYFNNNKQKIKDEKYELQEIIDLPADTIRTFLNCCQNQPTEIKDIMGINYLSIKYENDELKKFTEKYIEENCNELIFQSITFKRQIQELINNNQKNEIDFNVDTVKEEEILSTHFIDYLEDERIFSVPIHIVKRAMQKFLNDNKEIVNDQTKWKKIKDFLLRCLNEYKNKEASVLFSDINFNKLDRDLIVSLHNDFSEKFDFNMLNVKSLFEATYDLIGEVAQMKSQMKILCEEHLSEMSALNEFKMKIDQELNQIRQEQQKMNKNNEIEGKIQSLEEKQTNSFERIKFLEDNKNENDEKHNNVINRIQSLENNKKENDEKHNNVINKIQSLENSKKENDEKHNNVINRIQSLENSKRENDEKNDGLINRIQSLENNKKENDEKHNNVINKIQSLENCKKENDEKHSSFIDRIQSLENKNSNVERKLQDLDNFSGRLQTLERKQSTTESQISNFVTKNIEKIIDFIKFKSLFYVVFIYYFIGFFFSLFYDIFI